MARARDRGISRREPASAVRSIAEQAPPRKAQGLFSPAFGRIFAWPYRAAIAGLLWLRVTPNQLTLASLAVSLASAGMLLDGRRFLPGMLLVPAGLLDIFDGGVARARGREGPAGAWLDSVTDRASDSTVFGALFLSLASQGRDVEAGLALGALVVSLSVSFSRAQAQALGAQLREGLFARLERTVVLLVGLTVPGGLLWALLALVVLGGVALAQRVVLARKPLRGAAGDGGG